MRSKQKAQKLKAIGYRGGFALHLLAGWALCASVITSIRALELASSAIGKK